MTRIWARVRLTQPSKSLHITPVRPEEYLPNTLFDYICALIVLISILKLSTTGADAAESRGRCCMHCTALKLKRRNGTKAQFRIHSTIHWSFDSAISQRNAAGCASTEGRRAGTHYTTPDSMMPPAERGIGDERSGGQEITDAMVNDGF